MMHLLKIQLGILYILWILIVASFFRLYGWQKDIVVVQTSWIKNVLQQQCLVKDVPLNNHLLIPQFMAGLGLDRTAQRQLPKKESSSSTATSTYTQYNAVWNKLEQDCSDNQPEGNARWNLACN